MKYCLIPKRIIDNSLEIKYAYKEQTNNEDDTGWRLLDNKDSNDFENNDNIGQYDIEELIKNKQIPYYFKYLIDFISFEKIDDEWKYIDNSNIPEDQKVYFKDKFNEGPVHMDCTIADYKLPWNGETISIYCDSFEINCYYPIVPMPYHHSHGVYLPDICQFRGYFTKDELEDYYKRCEEKYQEHINDLRIQMEKMAILYEKLKITNNEMAQKCKFNFIKTHLHYNKYEIWYYSGSAEEKAYYLIYKYRDFDLRKRYFWNIDKSFKKIESEDVNTIIDEFINLFKYNTVEEKISKLQSIQKQIYENNYTEDDILLANDLSDELTQITKETYNNIGNKYAEIRNLELSDLDKRNWDILLSYVNQYLGNDYKNLKLLDVGTGHGRDLKHACDLGFQATGNDNSETFILQLIELSKKKIIPEKCFYHCDMKNLKGFNKVYDIVRQNATLLHLPIITKGYGVDKALEESNRVLKDNGLLFVTVKKGFGLNYIDTNEGLGGRVFQFYSEEEIASIIERNGFKVLHSEIVNEDRNGNNIEWILVIAQKTTSNT